MAEIDAAFQAAEADREPALARLFEILRIPSVSTEAAHRADCRRAAEWFSAQLAEIGLEGRLIDVDEAPGSHPLVYARTDRGAALRFVFYGHYDVQPVDPLALWETPPFEPTILDGAHGPEIRARGANDDKGQVMTFVEALRAWNVAGGAPVDVTVLLEGEEEAGGEGLSAFLKRPEARELLAGEAVLICDTSMWGVDRPAITTRLRGMVGGELIVRGPSIDLHSGQYGGAAANPLHVLSTILGDLHDAEGRVTLDGFYDGVREPSPEVAASWDALGFDASAFLGEVGLSRPAGEADRSALEQIWSRPTAEVNGVVGGYTGDGFKTVIPAEARAKISFRLVPGQDPDAIWSALIAHAEARTPADCTVEAAKLGAAPASETPTDSRHVRKTAEALEAEWGAPTALIGVGGSIPVVAEFDQLLDLKSVLVGFGQDDDRVHSPNEKYGLRNFETGVRSWVRILGALASD